MKRRRQDTYFSSGDLIGSNEDLLRNILIHIPHKSISTFKSVSKLWLSLITDPSFSLIWFAKHIPSPSALLFPTNHSTNYNYKLIPLDEQEKNSISQLTYFDFNFDPDPLPAIENFPGRIKILQSCNGLLLFSIISSPNFSGEVRIGVYNPTTNQLKLIPKLPKNHYHATVCTRSKLAFDPSKSPHYKVYSIVRIRTDALVRCTDGCFVRSTDFLIYSSEMDSWRVAPIDEAYHVTNSRRMFMAAVYWNGAIHWPEPLESCSFSFDIDKECFLETPILRPQTQQTKNMILRYFGESGGHLHLIEYEKDFTLKFDVLEMEKDYSKWFVKYTVDLTFSGWRTNPQDWLDQRFTILSLIVNKGEEESPVLVMQEAGEEIVISYNLKNKELKKLCALSLKEWDVDYRYSCVYQFIRSSIRFL